MQHRLWVCPECGIVRAIPEDRFSPEFPPICDAHTERWPNGEFSLSITMKKTKTFVEVEMEE